ncbi:hypothetical protein AKJ09_08908 [Labilithrix luteola]|uniref:Uncharacterized protein n=1 Tax=Labilithrix luteola TaxID=1391654 RepID=A0A0K1QA22_9BACT|nr:hypothetical protein AKJ09_08908 [Labilithrix luteola]
MHGTAPGSGTSRYEGSKWQEAVARIAARAKAPVPRESHFMNATQ